MVKTAIRENDEVFRSMFERHNAVMLLIDSIDGSIVDANKAAAEFYGYSRADLCNMNIMQINQYTPEQTQAAILSAKEESTNFFVFPHRIANGEIRTVEVHSTPIDVGGKEILFSVIHDITERKQADEELEKSEERYRSLIENQTDLVCRVTPEGQFLFVNDIYCKFYCKPEKELIGSKWQPLPVDDVVDFINEKLSTLSLQNPTFLIEHRVRSGKGEIHWMHFINSGIFDSQGNLLEIQSVGRDITSLKESEEALRSAESQLKSALQMGKAGAWGYHIDNDEIWASAEGARIYGFPPVDGPLPLEVVESCIPERERVNQALTDLIKEDHEYDLEFTVNPFDGSPSKVLRSTARLEKDEQGNPLEVFGFVQDITEDKKMEQEKEILTSQLEQSRKMEALGVMAGGMAHNFNNNLSVILGNIELAQMKQPHDSDTTPLLGNAKIAAQRSRDLIRRIIIYSRNKKQNKTTMLLLHVVNEAVKLVKPTLPSTINVQLSINPACDSVMIHTDASQIQEVLLELCNNAVQAMKEKGDLALSLKPVNLVQADIPSQYDADPGRYVKLCVQDSGCGMPAEILNKIFDPFFTTKEEYEGAGMGLSTVQGIVVEHGGLIKVDSTPGQGSTFTLYIPVIDEAEVTQEAHAEVNLSSGAEHILLIDDEQNVADVCGAMLEHLGYKVTVMISSVEALKLFKEHPDNFDLVMTDQTMPRMTGVELAKELLVVRPKIPIILCSGDSARFNEADAKEVGISAFCAKPIEMKQLGSVVREVLDTNEQPSVTT